MLREMKNTYANQISCVIQYSVDKIACILETLMRWMDGQS